MGGSVLAAKRKLQVEDLLAIRLAGDCQISPDGGRVAYVLQEIDREKNEYRSSIWMAREGRAPSPFTGGTKESSPRWSPDGSMLAFLSNRSGSSQIWLLSMEGGEARQLTRVKGGVSNPVWSPDGRQIAFSALLSAEGIKPEGKDEEERNLYLKFTKDVKVITRLQYKLDGTGFYGEKRAQICLIAADGSQEPVQLTSGDFTHNGQTWTPDSTGIIFAANRHADADHRPWAVDLWYLPVKGGQPQRLTPGDGGITPATPAVSPDGRWIAFTGTLPEDCGYGLKALYVLDRTEKTIRRLAAELDRSFVDEVATDLVGPAGGSLAWSPDGRWIYGMVSDAGQVQLVKVGLGTGAVLPLTGGERTIYAFSLSADCRRAALACSTPSTPGEVYLARLDQPQPAVRVANCGALLQGGGVFEMPLTHHNTELLGQLDLPVPERFRFCAAPGEPQIDGWVLPPAGRENGKRYPTVLEIHGGPMSMYSGSFFFEFQWLAALGYAVVFCNPRGSVGYGRAFCQSIMADWGDRDYADVMGAVDSAIEQFDFIDPQRLGVAGGSYGGFMVNWIVGRTDRFRAAVTMRSVVNRLSAMGTSDVGYDRLRQFGTATWWEPNQMAPYLKQSPLLHASKINTPLLIEHQENDLRCPIEQAEQLYAALKVQQKPVKFVRYPGESHGMSRTGKPWYRIHRLNMLADWFGQYLKP